MRSIPPAVIHAAQLSQKATRWPASVTCAQWPIESRWGESLLATKANNYFGIKARKGDPFVTMGGTEFVKGVETPMAMRFRLFGSMEECFKVHGELAKLGAYKGAMLQLPALGITPTRAQVDAFVDAMAPVYATSPIYAKTLKKFMADHALYSINAIS